MSDIEYLRFPLVLPCAVPHGENASHTARVTVDGGLLFRLLAVTVAKRCWCRFVRRDSANHQLSTTCGVAPC